MDEPFHDLSLDMAEPMASGGGKKRVRTPPAAFRRHPASPPGMETATGNRREWGAILCPGSNAAVGRRIFRVANSGLSTLLSESVADLAKAVPRTEAGHPGGADTPSPSRPGPEGVLG